MPLTRYRPLGHSGLLVSPLALGTMTFGTARWGANEAESRAIFNAYVDAGGNFADTADVYASGRSEEMLGRFIADRKLRDQIVIATKAGFSAGRSVHAGGNGAKHIHAALSGSLKRLGTDYVDVFIVHVWDSITPAHELLHTMNALVSAGMIRYWGMSNTPAWYVAQLATLASATHAARPIVMQYFYSLANRDIEDEHIPLARSADMAIMPWSPLAYGLLSGKYVRSEVEAASPRAAGLPRNAAGVDDTRPATDNRLDGANPFGDSLFTPRNWRIVDELRSIATETGETPARIALQWAVSQPGVTSTLMGVSRLSQVADNIAALDVKLSTEHRHALDRVSMSEEPRMLYSLFSPALRSQAVFGGYDVRK